MPVSVHDINDDSLSEDNLARRQARRRRQELSSITQQAYQERIAGEQQFASESPYLASVRENLRGYGTGITSPFLGIASALGSDTAQEMYAERQGIDAAIGQALDEAVGADRVSAKGFTEALGSVVPVVASGGLGAAAPLTTTIATSFGSDFAAQTQAGASYGDAATSATLKALTTGLITKYTGKVFGAGVEKAGNVVEKTAASQFIQRVTAHPKVQERLAQIMSKLPDSKAAQRVGEMIVGRYGSAGQLVQGAVGEGIEEAGDVLFGSFIDEALQTATTRDLSNEQFVDQMVDDLLASTAYGAAIGGGFSRLQASSRLLERARRVRKAQAAGAEARPTFNAARETLAAIRDQGGIMNTREGADIALPTTVDKDGVERTKTLAELSPDEIEQTIRAGGTFNIVQTAVDGFVAKGFAKYVKPLAKDRFETQKAAAAMRAQFEQEGAQGALEFMRGLVTERTKDKQALEQFNQWADAVQTAANDPITAMDTPAIRKHLPYLNKVRKVIDERFTQTQEDVLAEAEAAALPESEGEAVALPEADVVPPQDFDSQERSLFRQVTQDPLVQPTRQRAALSRTKKQLEASLKEGDSLEERDGSILLRSKGLPRATAVIPTSAGSLLDSFTGALSERLTKGDKSKKAAAGIRAARASWTSLHGQDTEVSTLLRRQGSDVALTRQEWLSMSPAARKTALVRSGARLETLVNAMYIPNTVAEYIPADVGAVLLVSSDAVTSNDPAIQQVFREALSEDLVHRTVTEQIGDNDLLRIAGWLHKRGLVQDKHTKAAEARDDSAVQEATAATYFDWLKRTQQSETLPGLIKRVFERVKKSLGFARKAAEAAEPDLAQEIEDVLQRIRDGETVGEVTRGRAGEASILEERARPLIEAARQAIKEEQTQLRREERARSAEEVVARQEAAEREARRKAEVSVRKATDKQAEAERAEPIRQQIAYIREQLARGNTDQAEIDAVDLANEIGDVIDFQTDDGGIDVGAVLRAATAQLSFTASDVREQRAGQAVGDTQAAAEASQQRAESLAESARRKLETRKRLDSLDDEIEDLLRGKTSGVYSVNRKALFGDSVAERNTLEAFRAEEVAQAEQDMRADPDDPKPRQIVAAEAARLVSEEPFAPYIRNLENMVEQGYPLRAVDTMALRFIMSKSSRFLAKTKSGPVHNNIAKRLDRLTELYGKAGAVGSFAFSSRQDMILSPDMRAAGIGAMMQEIPEGTRRRIDKLRAQKRYDEAEREGIKAMRESRDRVLAALERLGITLDDLDPTSPDFDPDRWADDGFYNSVLMTAAAAQNRLRIGGLLSEIMRSGFFNLATLKNIVLGNTLMSSLYGGTKLATDMATAIARQGGSDLGKDGELADDILALGVGLHGTISATIKSAAVAAATGRNLSRESIGDLRSTSETLTNQKTGGLNETRKLIIAIESKLEQAGLSPKVASSLAHLLTSPATLIFNLMAAADEATSVTTVRVMSAKRALERARAAGITSQQELRHIASKAASNPASGHLTQDDLVELQETLAKLQLRKPTESKGLQMVERGINVRLPDAEQFESKAAQLAFRAVEGFQPGVVLQPFYKVIYNSLRVIFKEFEPTTNAVRLAANAKALKNIKDPAQRKLVIEEMVTIGARTAFGAALYAAAWAALDDEDEMPEEIMGIKTRTLSPIPELVNNAQAWRQAFVNGSAAPLIDRLATETKSLVPAEGSYVLKSKTPGQAIIDTMVDRMLLTRFRESVSELAD